MKEPDEARFTIKDGNGLSAQCKVAVPLEKSGDQKPIRDSDEMLQVQLFLNIVQNWSIPPVMVK